MRETCARDSAQAAEVRSRALGVEEKVIARFLTQGRVARRSSNAQRIGGMSHCVGCGVVCEGEVDIDDGNFYCLTCWLVYHATRARLLQDAAHVPLARNLQGVASAPGSAQHE